MTDARFWISWYQNTEDYRPLTDPPITAVKHWWCSGNADEGATLCAVVEAATELAAQEAVRKSWPEASDDCFRFCEKKDTDWLPPSGRFPVKP
jgi:hypothetical protein